MPPTVRYRRVRGWTVRVCYKGRRAEKGGFGHGEDGRARAEAFARSVEAVQRSVDRWEGRRPGEPLSVAELVTDWTEIYGGLRSARTRITDRGRVARLAAWFGGRDARSLKPPDVARFATETMAERSAWVAIGCLSILRRALNLAAQAELLERSAIPDIGAVIKACRLRAESEERRADAWTRDEVATLLDVARRREPAFYTGLRFALATGARRGEMLALRWEDVDFSRRRVAIRRTVKPRGGTKIPKAGHGRLVPLSGELLDLLGAELERQRRAQLAGAAEPEWVFPSPSSGQPYSSRESCRPWRTWQETHHHRVWVRVRRRARARGVRPLPFHAARHTFVTWALEAGTAAKRVAEWVGCSVQVIERHYAHVIPTVEADLSFTEVQDGKHAIRDNEATARPDDRS